MLHEYAVDPSGLGRLGPMWMLMEQFGVSKGRVIAEFPKKWARMVYKALEESKCPDVERASIVERLKRLKQSFGRSSTPSESCVENWLRAALVAQQEHAFYAIVSEVNGQQCSEIITPLDATDDHPLWKVETGKKIFRSASEIAKCAGPLGRICKVLLFVDPYLSSDSNRLRVVLEVLRACGADDGSIRRIEFHVSLKCGQLEHFRAEVCNSILGKLKHTQEINIFQWDQKSVGDKMHPRYFLTERGGIRFDYGFAEGNLGETTDVELLSESLYEARWADYQPQTAAFDLRDSALAKLPRVHPQIS